VSIAKPVLQARKRVVQTYVFCAGLALYRDPIYLKAIFKLLNYYVLYLELEQFMWAAASIPQSSMPAPMPCRWTILVKDKVILFCPEICGLVSAYFLPLYSRDILHQFGLGSFVVRHIWIIQPFKKAQQDYAGELIRAYPFVHRIYAFRFPEPVEIINQVLPCYISKGPRGTVELCRYFRFRIVSIL
jgi:hypothetical protein